MSTSKKGKGTYSKVSVSKSSKKKPSSAKTQTVKKKYPYEIPQTVKTSQLTLNIRKRFNELQNLKGIPTSEMIGMGLLAQASDILDFAKSSGDYNQLRRVYSMFKDLDRYLLGKPYSQYPDAIKASEKSLSFYDTIVEKYKKLSETLEYYDSPKNMPKKVNEWYQGFYGLKYW